MAGRKKRRGTKVRRTKGGLAKNLGNKKPNWLLRERYKRLGDLLKRRGAI